MERQGFRLRLFPFGQFENERARWSTDDGLRFGAPPSPSAGGSGGTKQNGTIVHGCTSGGAGRKSPILDLTRFFKVRDDFKFTRILGILYPFFRPGL